MKLIISYSFLYYSLYERYRRHSMSNECHPFLPIITLSLCSLPALIILVRLLPVVSHDGLSQADWLAFFWVTILVANMVYFLRNGRWRSVVSKFEKLPEDVKSRSNIAANVVFCLMLSLFIVAYLTSPT